MSKSAVSIFAFSFYLFILGAVLVVIPNVLLSLFGIPKTDEVWLRVVGVLVIFLGYFYNHAARQEYTSFIRCMVHERIGVLVFFIAFVALGLAPAQLILFGVIDAAAAVWTAFALKADRQLGESG